jgi:lipopolysaccharide transport system ATP-binding protein
MPQPAIRVEGLGKKYKITHQTRGRYRTLRETVMDAAAAPVRWLKGERGTSAEEFWALEDVSFEVQPGEVVGIIGRNGAGKSTLLKMLSRVTKPTKGRIELNGRVGSLLEVGTGFHPELTGRENVYLNGSILGMTRREIDRKFDEIVAFAEVERFLDTPVKRYSSGMYVRLGFAVAAHLEPEILIIDEVLAVGDAGFQRKCLAKLQERARDGQTVLLVSHQMATVRDLCGHVVWLANGGTRGVGDTKQIVDQYLTESNTKTPTGTWVDLSSASRTGYGFAKYTAARCYGESIEQAPVCDGALHISVRILMAEGASPDLRIFAHVLDQLHTRLIEVNSFDERRAVHMPAGEWELTFSIAKLHLSPGTYIVNLHIWDSNDEQDFVADALRFDVIPPSSDAENSWSATSLVTRRCSYTINAVSNRERELTASASPL